jgi:secondary thiamine-phosphate synthase enzyme
MSKHTSASLLINENYDPDVLVDLESFFERLVPDGDPLFIHTAEGQDDMPAHIRNCSNANKPLNTNQGRKGCIRSMAGHFFCMNIVINPTNVAS